MRKILICWMALGLSVLLLILGEVIPAVILSAGILVVTDKRFPKW